MGLLNPLYAAVSWIILQFHTLYSKIFDPDSGWAWGLSIVSLVIVIRICLIPLFVKQIKATRNMQALQPKMKAIQERYKSDKQRQSEEMMKLYKETGTNPFSSCLPILVQSPFFFALYHVLTYISQGKTVGVITDEAVVESGRNAHIFGAPIAAKFTDSADKLADLSATVTDVRVVTVIMIVLMSASQFITQRQLMTKNVDLSVKTPFMQQQKMLMYVFPIMFAVFGINFPVGVLVYWLTTNAWTMGQQLFVIRRNPTPGSKAYAERQARLKAKGKLKEPEAAEPEDGAVMVKRQQPKRQSKSRRQAATGTGSGSGSGAGSAKQQPGTPGKPDQPASPDSSAGSAAKPQQKTGTGQAKPDQPGQSGQGGQSAQASTGQGGKGQQRKRNKPRQPTGSRPTKK